MKRCPNCKAKVRVNYTHGRNSNSVMLIEHTQQCKKNIKESEKNARKRE